MKIYIILFLLINNIVVYGQKDTLQNHSLSTTLVEYKYTAPNTWGYYLGHNHLFSQQFSEKYYTTGTSSITGVISHHAGVYTNGNNHAEFNIYNVGINKLPQTKLGGKQVAYNQMNLTGTNMTTLFDSPIQVQDSFFISFNLFDYAHGGYDGDTIGLLCGSDGCREVADLDKFGRNAIQRHNHSHEEWRDFYSQNFTPLATHLALYPIVDFTLTSNLKPMFVRNQTLKASAPFPNPSTIKTTINYELFERSSVTFSILSNEGKELLYKVIGEQNIGQYEESILLNSLMVGNYILLIQTPQSSIALKLTIE